MPQALALNEFCGIVLNRKIGEETKSKSIARRAGLRRLGRTQKVRIVKRVPRNPIKYCTLKDIELRV